MLTPDTALPAILILAPNCTGSVQAAVPRGISLAEPVDLEVSADVGEMPLVEAAHTDRQATLSTRAPPGQPGRRRFGRIGRLLHRVGGTKVFLAGPALGLVAQVLLRVCSRRGSN